jgi:hypothetical protein
VVGGLGLLDVGEDDPHAAGGEFEDVREERAASWLVTAWLAAS